MSGGRYCIPLYIQVLCSYPFRSSKHAKKVGDQCPPTIQWIQYNTMGDPVKRLKARGLQDLADTNYTKDILAEFILTHFDDQGARVDSDSGATSTQTDVLNSIQDMLSKSMDQISGKIDMLQVDFNKESQATRDTLIGHDTRISATETEVKDLKTLVSTLTDVVGKLTSTVAAQQQFLEHADFKERAKNLIIINVPEVDDLDGKVTDEDKVDYLFDLSKIKGRTGQYTVRRLGQPRTDGSSRPILVTLEHESTRKTVLQNAQNLKSSDSTKNIKMKRDQHPGFRKEWGRLFKAETTEKAKPENAGCDIEVDRKRRVLLRDGVVIDRWSLSDF